MKLETFFQKFESLAEQAAIVARVEVLMALVDSPPLAWA
jgi:hypothetical protein